MSRSEPHSTRHSGSHDARAWSDESFAPRGEWFALVARISYSSSASRAGHPGGRRCSSLEYGRYARSSRLARRAPRSEIHYSNS